MRLCTLIGRAPSGLPITVGSSASAATGVAGNRAADPLLLPGDHRGGGLADGQAAPVAGVLVVVVDEHRAAVGVAGQAVERQRGDLGGAAAGVHQQLDPGADLRPARAAFQVVQPRGQGAHDLRWQVAVGSGRSAARGTSPVVSMKLPASPAAGWPGAVRPSARIRPSARPVSWQIRTRWSRRELPG